MEKKLDLKNIVLIGRTFSEYYRMFDIHNISKNERILDVASGVSSFCAEARTLGYDVTASDRIYSFSVKDIEEKCTKDLEITMTKMEEIKDLYKWKYFKSIKHLKEHRKKAYEAFIWDFKQNSKAEYVTTEYPKSYFKDKQFNIALVSHFLFMYDEHLDYEFHKRVIEELVRITSKEIRVFPIVNLKCEKSLFVDKLIEDGCFSKYEIKTVKVNYEFVKGGNEMLVIRVQ
ncbi:hypothetical protein [Clostridium kluyveri]|uniref:SAM-dependent methyltransferase n=2 Tax=Clostridium kluyveri TaxID=1534 RepID=A5N3F9_CLOK5|nr:hypothetical protein [Clostridium kluyveri]EDK35655.1 Conserved hypothetical protein [Clostridium kluyveri DSM 555]